MAEPRADADNEFGDDRDLPDLVEPADEWDAGEVEQPMRDYFETHANTPLFAGAGLSTLSATLLLLNCLRNHRASNVLINELFGLLAKSVLPIPNSLPDSEYGASNILKRLGLGYFLKPRVGYVFSSGEVVTFLSTVSSTKVPTGFSSTLIKHVGEKKLAGVKSHDHHVLVQQVLPATIRHLLKKGPRESIIRLGMAFQRLCSKTIKMSELKELSVYVTETLCMFELWFPPGFFDIMPHLVQHLVYELEMCGPVHSRWCYAIERYLGNLTNYVRDKSRPEAGMASGYMVDESLGYCTEFFSLYPHTRRRVWDPMEEARDSGELLTGKGTAVRLTPAEIEHIHDCVIKHLSQTAPLMR